MDDTVQSIQRSSNFDINPWEIRYKEAAIYLEEGANNDKFKSHPKTEEAYPAYILVHNHIFYSIDLLASLSLLFLVLFETPSAYYEVPIALHGAIELMLLIVLTVKFILKIRWVGFRLFFTHSRSAMMVIILVLMCTEAIVVIIRQSSHFRVSRALRPILLIDNRYMGGVRRFIRQFLQCLPPILDMFSFLLVTITLFSVLGFFLFNNYPDNPYFDTFYNSFVSLFVLMTTSNYPSVMLPYYAVSPWSSWFFIIYLIIVLFILMNLLLAVVYEAFTVIEKDKFRKLYLHKRQACQYAFNLLKCESSSDLIALSHFSGMMKHYYPRMNSDKVYLVFRLLNKSDSGLINLEEFYKFYEAVSVTWRLDNSQKSWYMHFKPPFIHIFLNITKLVKWKYFSYFTYVVIFVNTIFILYRTAEFSKSSNNPALSIVTWDAVLFTVLYSLETILKLAGLGPNVYLSSGWNVFDLSVTISLVVATILEMLPSSIYFIVVLRGLRILTLFQIRSRLRDIANTMALLLPQMGSVLIVVLIIYYAFVIIGMELFSGHDLVNCCINSTIENYFRYSEGDPHQGYFYLNNFHNVLTSYVTLFHLTVVNDWYILMTAFALVTSEWSRLFFMSFYLVMMVVVTIIVAFILETFTFWIQTRRNQNVMKEYAIQERVIITREEYPLRTPKETLFCSGTSAYQRNLSSEDMVFLGEKKKSKSFLQLLLYNNHLDNWTQEALEANTPEI